MTQIILYQEEVLNKSFDDFLQGVYNSRMDSLASDLLHDGFEPQEIIAAINRALKICKTAGINSREHFYPVLTQYQGATVKDCKLSQFAYGLVLLNASENNTQTAQFQVKLITQFLNIKT